MHATSIAATEWYIDSHACSFERYGDSRHEGKVILHMETFPGMVPYEALLPGELDNLLVVNCVSSTHIGWNTIRLEPTWMNIGEGAGWALVLARNACVAPADVDRQHLVRTLARSGVMVSFCNDVDVASREAWVAAAQYFGTRGFFAGYDVRPHEPLGRRTAEVWLQAAARAGSPDYDPMRTVRAVHDLAAGTDEPIDGAALETLLARSALAGKPGVTALRAPERVTRADFCRLLFDLTAPRGNAG